MDFKTYFYKAAFRACFDERLEKGDVGGTMDK